jgi:beta-glucosidase
MISKRDETAMKRAEELVQQMTVEEAASQMLHEAPAIERLNIPSYNWWNEALHGVARAGLATVFPQAIGLAAVFSPDWIFRMAELIADEARAKYNTYQAEGDHGINKGLTFWSPNVNIFRDPRWGRGQETFGEDPNLSGALGSAFVKGLQGEGETMKAAACAKHYAVHSGPEGVRHSFDAKASAKDMAETYLPAFKTLVEANVEGVMGAYNRVNGVPACGSEELLTEILRNEWNFNGYIVSDCYALADFHLYHKYTKDALESAVLAINSGLELNCGCTYKSIMEGYEKGLIQEETIRKAATRLMATRFKLGMFDESTLYDSIPYDVVDSEEHRSFNLSLTERSVVLLKNKGLLPLDMKAYQKIAVIGPNADNNLALYGNYHGTMGKKATLLEAMYEAFPTHRITYAEGCHLYKDSLQTDSQPDDGLSEALIQAKEADLVIMAIGLDETIEGEEIAGQTELKGDKADLYLPKPQRKLLKAVLKLKKPIIVINFSGSAIDLEEANTEADAIIQAWYPGACGGYVLVDLMKGTFSPSGKLPVTFYPEDHSLPDFEDYSMDNRTYKFYKGPVLYPFGFGLSYTTFEYSNLQVREHFEAGQSLKIQFTLENTGKMDAEEVCQVYLHDLESAYRVPQYKLVAFERVALAAGQRKDVVIEVDSKQFQVVDDSGQELYEKGAFDLYVGGSQPDKRSAELLGVEPLRQRITMD